MDVSNPNLDLWLGAAVLALVAFGTFLLWRLHRSHVDVADEPIHLPTETISRRSRPLPIEIAEGQRCPGCHGDLAHAEGLHRCHECSTVLHWECYRELGCPTMGCAAAFTRRTENGEFPAPASDSKKDDEPPLKVSIKA